jgi:hypothetical protein
MDNELERIGWKWSWPIDVLSQNLPGAVAKNDEKT